MKEWFRNFGETLSKILVHALKQIGNKNLYQSKLF